MAGTDLVTTLRQEIDRKHSEAIQALETIAAYLTSTPDSPASAVVTVGSPATNSSNKTRVAKVLAAIARDFKTVDDLATELRLPEASVRAVLYSKFVKTRVSRGKIGKKVAFRSKAATPASSNGSARSAAGLVKDILAANPAGLTSADVNAKIATELASIGGNSKAVAAALYKLKKSKLATHDTAGVYRLVSK